MQIDPWGSSQYQDYNRLREEFGIEPFGQDIVAGLPNAHPLLQRGVVFGCRGFGPVARAIRGGDPWGVMTGLMPSGRMHLGHKMLLDQVVYWQTVGADVTMGVADFEAYATRGLTLAKARELAIEEYVRTYLALGLAPERGSVYFQTRRHRVKDLAYEMSLKVTLSTMRSLYGFSDSTNLAHLSAPLMQAADILHVQRLELGGPRPTLVPVGVDQDPHIRLARDLAAAHRLYSVKAVEEGKAGVFVKGDDNVEQLLDVAERVVKGLGFSSVSRKDSYKALYVAGAGGSDLEAINVALAVEEPKLGGWGFVPPAATYHRFLTGLDGGKMSSSRPQSAIFITDSLKEADKKLAAAKTGGKQTVELQRKYGGDPDNCAVYEHHLYHLVPDDRQLADIYRQCKAGELLCGECKGIGREALKRMLGDLQEKRAQVTEADIRNIVAED